MSTELSSNLHAELASGAEVVRATPAEVVIRVVDPSGATVAPEGLALDPQILPTGDRVEWHAVNDSFVLELPESATTTDLDAIDLRPKLHADPEEGVTFVDARLSIPVRRPEYPTVIFPDAVNGRLRPAVFDAPGKIRIAYTVVGPQTGNGCAVGAPEAIKSSGGDTASVLFPDGTKTCVSSGQQLKRTAVIDVTGRIEARFCGSIGFELTGDQAAEPRITRQSICVRTERGPNAWTRLGAAALMLVGLAPMLVLALLNRRNARLGTAGELSVATPQVREEDGALTTLGGAPLLDEAAFVVADHTSYALPLLDGRYIVQSRPNTTPRVGKRGHFSPTMLFSGPRGYLIAADPEQPIIVGSGPHHLHTGPLPESLRLPANLARLWIVEIGDRGAGRSTPLKLAVVRVFGSRPPLPELSDGIRSVVDDQLPNLSSVPNASGGLLDDF